ncbi:hypothetical protein PC9H_006241 [Pleurotus ostreatus]|uniref:Uncharacterized protein n=1 Tax=Pleurotus ostreatus TaxID=5322 RepID=A0A8H7DSU7_PLEOS|nr:uncharacterized protein PC9H_006241 [Pleurotus ostreatus]KAF7430533.1 hypothetical protein PC9H_006241 [Pleurotus ostreatus]
MTTEDHSLSTDEFVQSPMAFNKDHSEWHTQEHTACFVSPLLLPHSSPASAEGHFEPLEVSLSQGLEPYDPYVYPTLDSMWGSCSNRGNNLHQHNNIRIDTAGLEPYYQTAHSLSSLPSHSDAVYPATPPASIFTLPPDCPGEHYNAASVMPPLSSRSQTPPTPFSLGYSTQPYGLPVIPQPPTPPLASPQTPYGSSGPNSPHHSSSPFPPSQQSADDRERYSHREQIQFFKEAHSLPSAHDWGAMVPQQMYRPHTNSDRRRYVEDVKLEGPMYFYMEHGVCGISLSDALHSRVRKLRGRDETVFEGRGPSVSIRLEWPGYRQWSRQIPTKDFRSPPGPITRAKLAKNVAKCVKRFIEDRQNETLEDEADERWRVGSAPTSRIKFEDLVLVSIHHVSMGSWQPQLRVKRGH